MYGRAISGTEKEIKDIQFIALYFTPAGEYPTILHGRSIFIHLSPLIMPHLKPEADQYIL